MQRHVALDPRSDGRSQNDEDGTDATKKTKKKKKKAAKTDASK